MEESWANLAFSLGIPAADASRPNSDAKKFAQRIRRRQDISNKQMLEYLGSLMGKIRKNRPSIRHKKSVAFCPDAIPQPSNSAGIIPIPCPGLTIGYRQNAFCSWHVQIQNGIISGEDGTLHLAGISQPIPNVYWPFLVIEVSEESMLAAQHLCGAAAATCSNAVMILSRAVFSAEGGRFPQSFYLSNSQKAAISFSLAVHDRVARLNVHQITSNFRQECHTVRCYRLFDEYEVEALVARIESILLWAEHSRLPAIVQILEICSQRPLGQRLTGREFARPLPELTPPTSTDSSPLSGIGPPDESEELVANNVFADDEWLPASSTKPEKATGKHRLRAALGRRLSLAHWNFPTVKLTSPTHPEATGFSGTARQEWTYPSDDSLDRWLQP